MEPLALNRILNESIDARWKGFPPTAGDVSIADVGQHGWNALNGDFLLPILVLKETAIAHNIALMAAYCERHEVDLAPHGKTTMAPQLFDRQLAAGAWGITAATASQARLYRSFGVERIVLANEIVERGAIEWVSAELDADPAFSFLCLVDSPAAVKALVDARAGGEYTRPLWTLVELGIPGGRTGCRTVESALDVAAAVSSAPGLELAGVEGFEGIIHSERAEDSLASVDAFLAELRRLTETLAHRGAFEGHAEIVVTVGGSSFFDRVVAQLGGLTATPPVRLVLRSGCYVTHDSGLYEDLSPLGGRSVGGDRLRAALEVWGVVLSRPEPGLVLAGMGKRDVAYDIELPIPLLVNDVGGLRDVKGSIIASDLNDQHLYLRVPPADPVAVGDLIGCGVSHPCTAFDKWRLIPVVDDKYCVINAIMTFF